MLMAEKPTFPFHSVITFYYSYESITKFGTVAIKSYNIWNYLASYVV